MERRYLDAAAVAPLLPAAREAMLAALDDGWADPRRLHREGRRARLLLEGARESVAEALGARTEEVSFTGSHVQAVHEAVLAVMHARRRAGRIAVTTEVEHSAVLNATTYAALETRRVEVDRLGRVDPDAFSKELTAPGVALACLQTANGEVGTLQPVEEVAPRARAASVPLLVDAAASIGHHPPPVGWDLLVADPRAWGAPPGVGVLAVRAGVRWLAPAPEHEGTERIAGEVSIPAVLAAAVALRELNAARSVEGPRRRALVHRIREAAARVPDTEVAGAPLERLPHIVTFSCLGVDGEALVDELDRHGFAVGSGSACTAASVRPSHVLAALGVLTHGNVRIGLPIGIDSGVVEEFCRLLPEAVGKVRSLLGEPITGGMPAVDSDYAFETRVELPVNATGLRCPLPVVRLAATVRQAAPGTLVHIYSTDPAAGPDVAAWCRMRGHTLLDQREVSADAIPAQVIDEHRPPPSGPVLLSRVRVN